jgi:uncharacterized DUF497 family protein
VFEWDPRKAAANAEKHGVTFAVAVTVFLDPDALDGRDLAHSASETRYLRLGRAADGRVLMVAYTLRRGDDLPKRSVSSARGGRAGANARRTRRRIDFGDVPEASAAQLKAMRRVGRPPLGDAPRQLIAIRVDARVLEQFRKEARRRRVGYQTLINEVLAQHVRRDVA